MLDKQQIFATLDQLAFNPEDYILVCGAACVIYGIRQQTHDIDLACSEAMMDELVKQGYPVIQESTRRLCKMGDIDIFEKWPCEHKVKIEGYYVQSIEDLQKDKLRLNREKDQLDIQRIHDYRCAQKLRLANNEDLDDILQIINEAKQKLANQQIDQWQYGYPNRETFKQDIKKNQLYVYEDTQVIGVMSLIFGEEKTYRQIDGQWLNDNAYATIHRLAVKQDYQKSNVASSMIAAARFIAHSKGIHSLRGDTHHHNKDMRKCLERNGFVYCGVIQLEEQSGELSRMAYQCDFQ